MMNKPFLNYHGGKRRHAKYIVPLIRENLAESGTYYEPFVGGGAIWFALEHDRNVIADILPDLINMYECIKEDPERVLFHFDKFENNRESYYQIRDFDRNPYYYLLSNYFKAARFIYLSITGFGSFRYNSKGLMNQSYFRHPERTLKIDENVLRSMWDLLQRTEIKQQSFEETLKLPTKGDFVYLDPPYIDRNYNSYYTDDFTLEDMKKLKQCCDELTERGVKFALSHTKCKEVDELFKDYPKRELSMYMEVKYYERGDNRREAEYIITNF